MKHPKSSIPARLTAKVGLLGLLPALAVLSTSAQAALIAHYEFEAGSELVDSTGISGSLVKVEQGPSDYTIGGGFVSFSGSSSNNFDYLRAPDFNFDTAASAWSLQFDVRDPGGAGGPHPTAAGIISSNEDAGGDSWQLNSATTGLLDETGNGRDGTGANNDGGADGFFIGDLSDGNWHTVLLVHEANAVELLAYFNGNLVDPADLDWEDGRVTLKTMTLGANRAENLQASVDLDNIMVWNTAIPEPSSSLLAILGASTMFLRRRR